MNRFCEVELGGKPIKLAVTFGALEALCDMGADPLEAARYAFLEGVALEDGNLDYDSPFKLSSNVVAGVLRVAERHTEGLEGVDGMILDAGLFEAKGAAAAYLAAFCTSYSEEDAPPAKGEPEK